MIEVKVATRRHPRCRPTRVGPEEQAELSESDKTSRNDTFNTFNNFMKNGREFSD